MASVRRTPVTAVFTSQVTWPPAAAQTAFAVIFKQSGLFKSPPLSLEGKEVLTVKYYTVKGVFVCANLIY